MPHEKTQEDKDISGYQLRAQLAARLNAASHVQEAGRNTYLGVAAAIGAMGIAGGTLDAIDTMENKELEWIITFAVYGAVVLAVMLYLLWHIIRIAAHNTDASRDVLGTEIAYLLEFAGKTPLAHANGAAQPSITTLRYNNGKAGDSVTITGSGFSDPAQVLFGTVAATDFNAVSDSSIIVEVPENSATTTGTLMHVAVITPAGRSADSRGSQVHLRPLRGSEQVIQH